MQFDNDVAFLRLYSITNYFAVYTASSKNCMEEMTIFFLANARQHQILDSQYQQSRTVTMTPMIKTSRNIQICSHTTLKRLKKCQWRRNPTFTLAIGLYLVLGVTMGQLSQWIGHCSNHLVLPLLIAFPQLSMGTCSEFSPIHRSDYMPSLVSDI